MTKISWVKPDVDFVTSLYIEDYFLMVTVTADIREEHDPYGTGDSPTTYETSNIIVNGEEGYYKELTAAQQESIDEQIIQNYLS